MLINASAISQAVSNTALCVLSNNLVSPANIQEAIIIGYQHVSRVNSNVPDGGASSPLLLHCPHILLKHSFFLLFLLCFFFFSLSDYHSFKIPFSLLTSKLYFMFLFFYYPQIMLMYLQKKRFDQCLLSSSKVYKDFSMLQHHLYHLFFLVTVAF